MQILTSHVCQLLQTLGLFSFDLPMSGGALLSSNIPYNMTCCMIVYFRCDFVNQEEIGPVGVVSQ